MTRPDTLLVSEVFGPTVQGEGPSAGRRAGFVRFGECNLNCSWCDTPYTWDADRFDLTAEMDHRTVDRIVAEVLTGDPGRVVLTGGEPLLNQRRPGWSALLVELRARGVVVEVETNGTIPPTTTTAGLIDQFNVSPKLFNSGILDGVRRRPRSLAALLATGKAVFKFVCADADDVAEAAALSALHGIPDRLVWVMPLGTTAEEITRHLAAIADPAIRFGFNLTTRLHVLAWGDERGR